VVKPLHSLLTSILLTQKKGYNITHLLVTHGHPDHIQGSFVIKQAFPSIEIIASSDVAVEMGKSANGTLAFFNSTIGTFFQFPPYVPAPTPIMPITNMTIDGEMIYIRPWAQAEAVVGSYIYVPSLEAILGSDLLYNKVHLYLVDASLDGTGPNWFSNWTKILDNLFITYPNLKFVYPGHGANGSTEIINNTKQYIETFTAALFAGGSTYPSVRDAITTKYPDYAPSSLNFLDMALKKWYPTYVPPSTIPPTNTPTNTPTNGPTNTPTNGPTNAPTNTPTTLKPSTNNGLSLVVCLILLVIVCF